jgi:glycosyltransferase involved in cell wall biosynthesis
VKNPLPRVSIGLPVFNGEKYLPKALESLLAQEYENFELVISDNASTDETGLICENYARRDDRIRYYRNLCNIGLAPNHNRVFSLSRGELFKWAAHDDEYPQQMLRRYVEVFDAAPSSVGVVYSACEYIDEMGNLLGTDSDHLVKKGARPAGRLAHLLKHISVYNCTYGLIRSEMLRKTRLHGSFPVADRVLFSELTMLGEFIEIAEPLLRLRIHKARSFATHRSAQALRELFDPGSKTRRSFLTIEGRVQLELIRSAWRMPSHLSDKLSCLCVALAVPSWTKFKNFGGRQKTRLTGMIGQCRDSCKTHVA